MAITKIHRLGIENYNYQGCLMQIIEYNNANNILVEFKDKYKAIVSTSWQKFNSGSLKNPYYPSVCDVGITGNKYPTRINGIKEKEYDVWRKMLQRCFDEETKHKQPAYKDVTCCEDWLLYENFYEWLHSQENFEKWKNEKGWTIDKDILIKGNKIYSPATCCLVPNDVNVLFTKRNSERGSLPIGVVYHKVNKKYISSYDCGQKYNRYLGSYDTPEKAFEMYKSYKEEYIKQIAQEEYSKGNITKRCYDAMMNYQVEITD